MEIVKIESGEELRDYLGSLQVRPLFRGQTNHYGPLNSPSATTSFDRHGCIPPEMFKWWNYTSDILSALIGAKGQSFPFVQALLQHYGWRSFFLDATTDPSVASWFASHKFRENTAMELCEDCFERGVMLRKHYAQYEFEPGLGHLYVLDRDAVEASAGVVDLKAISLDGWRPRFIAQRALLVGPLHGRALSRDCYHAHITIDRTILKQHAADNGFAEQHDLFPGRDRDPVLSALLDLPWAEIKSAKGALEGLKFFRRAVEFPEYSTSWQKILPNRIALYHGSSIEDLPESPDGTPEKTISMRVPTSTALGQADLVDRRFPEISHLLEEHNCVIFEIDDLIQYAPHQGHFLYFKGVTVAKKPTGMIEVGALLVEHQGMELTGAGLNVGWYYRPDETGNWNRVRHSEECPCGNEEVHRRHLTALRMIDCWLAEPTAIPLP